jgi:hypothetical protein
MPGGILPPELKAVEELLSGDKIFTVPKYQRNFAWTKDEVQELWEDVGTAIEGGKPDYFIGTIVTRDQERSFEIIDGQQRLACLSMIFSAIRNVFRAKNDNRAEQVFLKFLGSKDFSAQSVPKPKLVLNQHNNPIYEQFVIENVNSVEVGKELKKKTLSLSNRLLLEAYKFFLDQIGAKVGGLGTQSDDYLVPLINCLKSSVKIIAIPVTSEDDAYQIFESLNARGKELAVSDLVKNRLYALAGNQVRQAQQFWEKVEGDLARRPIPEYLRHFWIAKRAPKDDLKVREKALYRTIVRDVKGKSQAIKLLTALSKSARNYAMISDYALWPNDPNYDKGFEQALDELSLFRVSQCYPVLLNASEIFAATKEIAKTFRAIANFSFRYNIIGGGTSGDLESVFGEIAYGIRAGTHQSAREVADALRSVNPDNKFRADFELAVIPTSKAKLARYVLGKINDYSGGQELIANVDPKIVNLEHILPQSPDATWKAGFGLGINLEEYIHRIGNLTLLTTKVNDKVANQSFQRKKELAFKPSKLALNGFLKRTNKWNAQAIDKRQKEMGKIAVQVWNL